MEISQATLIDNLNNLVEINNDRIEGYETAIEETEEKDLQDIFREMASHSRTFKNDLGNEIRRLGGTPTESTRNSGKLYRAWMDIKAALSGKDRKAILSSCVLGEHAALEAYEDILESDEEIPSGIIDLLNSQKENLQADHDFIKALSDVS